MTRQSSKPTILATGLSGLVGSRLAHLLGPEFNFISLSLDQGIDILNFEKLQQIFSQNRQALTVLHLAAFTDVSAAHQQRGDQNGSCYRVNVIGSENIARLCAENHLYLIHVSTDFVFDGRHPPPSGYTENEEPHPIEWYGETKLLAEKAVLNSRSQNCILRIAFPFKTRPEPPELEPVVKLDLVRNILEEFKNNTLTPKFTDQIITPTFIDDIANVIKVFLQRKITGLYHCVGSSSISPYEMAGQIADYFGFEREKIPQSTLAAFLASQPEAQRRPRQKLQILSNQKIQKETGLNLKTFSQALQEIKKQLIEEF